MLSVVRSNVVMPNVSKLSVIMLSVEYINAENRYVNVMRQCHYAESTYAECRYAECRGATDFSSKTFFFGFKSFVLSNQTPRR